MVQAEKTFKIYKSSAGSGKTFTLVREYLRIVLKHPELYRSVLAITFTNKAAGEMKERIISELRQLADGQDSPMLNLIQEDTGLPKATLIGNADQVLSLILHNYGHFAVSTIDAFTYKLIRIFARDLDLPSKFDVETDTQALLDRMIDQLLDTIGRDEYITQILVHFAEEKLRDEAGWHVEKDIGDVARELFKESSKAPIDTLHELEPEEFMDFIEFIGAQKDGYPETIRQKSIAIVRAIEGAGLSFANFSGGSRSSCVKIFWKLDANRILPSEYQKLLETGNFIKAYNNDKWYSQKDQAAAIDALLDSGLRQQITEIVEYHEQHFDAYVTAFHAYQNIHSLAVLRQIQELMDVYKEQNNLVHISDFQDKISDFIQDEAADYIYWRLGERYRHYLLDEFQDTSVLQWLNLKELFDYVRHDADRDGSLLLVGDSKQAIYRWRGGEVELLENIAPDTLNVEPLFLETNFRSHEFVVDFNNRFFTKVREVFKSNTGINQIYQTFSQKIRPGNEDKGLAQIKLLEGRNNSEFYPNALQQLLSQIRECEQQGYRLRDMAILVRKSADGSQIAQYLHEHGVAVISSDSILLARAPVVNFVVSLFKFLIDPRDRIAQAELLTYFYVYLGGISEDEDHAAAFFEVSDPQLKIRELLQSETAIQDIFSVLPPAFKRLSNQLDRLPLYELAERIFQIFQLHRISPAYLQHFLDVVLEYAERKKPDLTGFLEYWNDHQHQFSVKVPEGENAVEIITIHKSKGLEFPVVFIPFANWEIRPRFNHSFWARSPEVFGDLPDTYLVQPRKELVNSQFGEDYQAEIGKTVLDNINLLYVAFTRARERLYVYGPIWNRKANDELTEEKISSVSKLLNVVLEDDEFAGLDSEMYESGFPLPPESQKLSGEPGANVSRQAEELLGGTWRNKIRIDRKFRKFWEKGEGQESGSRRISEGTIIVEAFRRMGESDELSMILTDLQEEGMLDEARRLSMVDQLEKLLEKPPYKAWFESQRHLRRATEILSPSGISYAPDRLLIRDGDVTFIDFIDADRQKAELKNLRAYRKMLLDMGYNEVNGYVCRLPGGKVDVVR